MGSEGRGEQTFRTDQDNGLILRSRFRTRSSKVSARTCSTRSRTIRLSALSRRCDGAQSGLVKDCRRISRRLLAAGSRSAMRPRIMNVAIFYDAEAVAGDPALLADAKAGPDRPDARRDRSGSRVSRARSTLSLRRSASSTISSPRGRTATRSISRKAASFRSCMACGRSRSNMGCTRPTRRKRIARLAEAGVVHARFARELTAGAALSDDAEARRADR